MIICSHGDIICISTICIYIATSAIERSIMTIIFTMANLEVRGGGLVDLIVTKYMAYVYQDQN